jgi:hypothetical protein
VEFAPGKIIFPACYPFRYDGFGTMTMWRRPSVDLQLAAYLRGELILAICVFRDFRVF